MENSIKTIVKEKMANYTGDESIAKILSDKAEELYDSLAKIHSDKISIDTEEQFVKCFLTTFFLTIQDVQFKKKIRRRSS